MGTLFTQLSSVVKNLFQWWIVLAPWEQALRVRRGRNVKFLTGGMHIRIPLLDRFFVQSVRLRITDLPIQTITTEDGKTVTLKGQLGYRICNLEKLYETLHDAEGTLQNMAQMEVANYVVSHHSDECHPRDIVAAVQDTLAEKLPQFGLGATQISITDYARVKTYRLISQDIWSQSGAMLNTSRDHHATD